MENLNITKTEITWERTHKKFDSEFKYKSQILNHGDHISISRLMYIDGKLKNQDLTHIPLELIDEIKKIKQK